MDWAVGLSGRYALKFRTVVDPFKSLYFISEEQRRREAEEDQGDVDIEALEAEVREGPQRGCQGRG